MYTVHIDFRQKRVTVEPDRRASFDLKGAKVAARRWADHYGFELVEEDDAAEPS